MMKLKVNKKTLVLGKPANIGAELVLSDKLVTHPTVASLLAKGILSVVKEEPAVTPKAVEIEIVVPEVVEEIVTVPEAVIEVTEVVESAVLEEAAPELVEEKPKSRRKRKE